MHKLHAATDARLANPRFGRLCWVLAGNRQLTLQSRKIPVVTSQACTETGAPANSTIPPLMLRYLDVMTAETDLRTAQINYFNALYLVISSKIDVEQSKGTISF